MPHVIVKLYSGKSERQKQALAQAVTKAVMSALNYGEDSDRDSGAGVGTARRRSDRGDPSGRRRVVSARTETLAWRVADECHDPHRHPGVSRWQGRRLDGEGQRRAIPEAMSGPLP